MSVFITLLNSVRAEMVNFVICLKSQEEEIKISQTYSRIIFTDVWPFKLYHYNFVYLIFFLSHGKVVGRQYSSSRTYL